MSYTESSIEKLAALRSDLLEAEKRTPLKDRASTWLGIGAVAECSQPSANPAIGIFLAATDTGVRVRFSSDSQPTLAEEFFEPHGNDVVTRRTEHSLNNDLSLATMRTTVEFGHIATQLFGNTPTNFNHRQPEPVSSQYVKYLDEIARHFISQATTVEPTQGDQTMQSHRGIRLPIKEYNLRVPTHTNVYQFIRRYQDLEYSGEELRLTSGLPLQLVDTHGRDYEGNAIGIIADTFSRLRDTTIYPDGPLFRPHSACRASEGATNANAYDLESYFAQLKQIEPHLLKTSISEYLGDLAFKKPGVRDPRCDCLEQLQYSEARIAVEGGIRFDFIHQEGRGYGLLNKEEMLRLSDLRGVDTPTLCESYGVEPDIRVYEQNATTLYASGLRKMRMFSNNPRKIRAYQEAGIEVAAVPVIIPTATNGDELRSKRRMGHDIPTL